MKRTITPTTTRHAPNDAGRSGSHHPTGIPTMAAGIVVSPALQGSRTWPSIWQRIDAKGRSTYSFIVPALVTPTPPTPPPAHRPSAPGGDGPTAGDVHDAPTQSRPNVPTTNAVANVTTCNEHGGCLSGQAAAKASTLRRHYYPEGSWGWVVLLVGTLQAILNHGVQLSGPLYLLPAGERFHQPAVNSCARVPFGRIPNRYTLGEMRILTCVTHHQAVAV
uniref:Uncharacterized protein n=1 Tax=Anopheles farauti TaxID=69004 RepID=A0A182Q8S4_9DIPT